MYYILLQLKTRGRGVNCEPKGAIWSTSLSKKNFPPGDSLEKFLEREKAEVLTTARSYKEVQTLMEKWYRFIGQLHQEHIEVGQCVDIKNTGDVSDLARTFFGGKK